MILDVVVGITFIFVIITIKSDVEGTPLLR